MSLPKPIRKELSAFNMAVRDAYPGKIIMTRVDISSLRLVAFMKDDGAKSWENCPAFHNIPHNILDPSYTTASDFRMESEPVSRSSSQNESSPPKKSIKNYENHLGTICFSYFLGTCQCDQ